MRIRTVHLDDLQPVGPGGEPPVPADVAVVIDVVRAFTVAPWCLARGATRLLLAPDREAAVSARDGHPGALLLKDGGPDPRFDLPNAPGRIAREHLSGRTVIQVTGNGTRGAYAVGRVPVVLCASFVTAGATARAIARTGRQDVLMVPTEGDEDVAMADYLTRLLTDGADGGVDPTPYLERVRRSDAGQECLELGRDPRYPGVDPEDLDRCLELDAFGHALRATGDGDLLAVTPA